MFLARSEPVQKLHYGVAHFSKSFWGDFRIAFQNGHALLGIFLHHPKHTYDTRERVWALLCTLLLACGLSLIMSSIARAGQVVGVDTQQGSPVILTTTMVSLAIQVPYDTFLNFVIKCHCVQHWIKWQCAKKCIVECGRCAIVINLCFALQMLLAGIIVVAVAGQSPNDGIIAFLISKLVGFFGTTVLIMVAMFWWKRRGERKQEKKTGHLFKGPHVKDDHPNKWKITKYEDLPESPPFGMCSDTKDEPAITIAVATPGSPAVPVPPTMDRGASSALPVAMPIATPASPPSPASSSSSSSSASSASSASPAIGVSGDVEMAEPQPEASEDVSYL